MRTPLLPVAALCGIVFYQPAESRAQLLSSLEAMGSSVSVIDPDFDDPENLQADGPKELATADFDLDGKPDLAASKVFGKVAVSFGEGGKKFAPAQFLLPPEGTGELRGIDVADFDGDGRPDIAVAAPYSGTVVIFRALPGRNFADPVAVDAGRGVRNLLAIDMDGDGDNDLLAGGPVGDGDRSNAASLRSLVNSGGTLALASELELVDDAIWDERFPRPVFAMSTMAPPIAGDGDWAVITHPESDKVRIVSMAPDGALVEQWNVPSLLPTRAIAVGAVTTLGGLPDLIQAARDENQILVRPSDGVQGLFGDVDQRLYIPGAPRALALADVDNDGWQDVLVVLRNYDRVVTFHNEFGQLKLVAEAPVGSSPRDLVPADFNGDGRIDLAVANRRSDNISVLLTQPDGPGFERLDTVYSVDGGVSGLYLEDLNGDGRDDVIQSHVLTSEISVRLAGEGGVLAPAKFTKLTAPPVSFRTGDFDGDGDSDLIVTHNDRWQPGLSILFADGTGAYEPPNFLPSTGGGLFSVIVADFDGDGVKDAAVGNYDCRLTMFKGEPDGSFVQKRVGLFTYEARAMLAGDFDQDGDLDLAGASAIGHMTVVENDGSLLTEPPAGTSHRMVYTRNEYEAPAGKGRIRSMVEVDWNDDGDQDVAINSEDGVSVFLGGEGLLFEALPEVLPGTRGSSDLAIGDLDGDGEDDLVTACRLLSCVTILKGRAGGGGYDLSLIAPVPSSDHLAIGDIDGDGKADLAGSGDVLWIALSSRAPSSSTGALESSRVPIDSMVINELLASNLTLVDAETGRTPDLLELFNGKEQTVPMAGWTLTYERTPKSGEAADPPVTYTFPNTAFVGPRERMVLVCDRRAGDFHTPFKLAREGATLTLAQPDGTVVDTVTYGEQEPDISLGRYTDGVELMTLKEDPDLGAPNFSTATIEPDFDGVSIAPETLAGGGDDGGPLLLVDLEDDIGIFTLTAVWQTLDGEHSGRLGMFDDGMHEDGGPLDDRFAARFPELPPGSRVEFFLQATNLIDEEQTEPGDPVFSLPGHPVTNYSFALPAEGAPLPYLEVSEVQPYGRGVDLAEQSSDYIEVRNIGDAALELDRFALRDSVFESDTGRVLSGTLDPGEYKVFFANAGSGEAELPFTINGGGDSIWLVELDDRAVPTVLEKVRPTDEGRKGSWSRLSPGGEFVLIAPTQGAPNVPMNELFLDRAPGDDSALRLWVSAPDGTSRGLEIWSPETQWISGGVIEGDGFETYVDLPIGTGTELFRVRE